MLKTKFAIIGLLVVTLGFCVSTRGAELGMPAPELSIAQWIKEQPIDLKAGKGKTIYVVEFWATWCPPCRESIPHLTEMQKKFKDKQVSFVGVSDEAPAKIKPFVEKMGAQMDYAVAADDQRKTFEAYLRAFGVNGIPHAFVINKDGSIVWHGHPMGELDEVLNELVSGKFDLELAKKVDRALRQQDEYFKLVSGSEKSSRAAEMGQKIVNDFSKTPGALNEFAWRILTDRDIRTRDLDLALRAAKTAYDTTGSTNLGVMDTYARALFDTGKHEEAIKVQKAAVAACKDERQRIELEATLNRFQRLAKEPGR